MVHRTPFFLPLLYPSLVWRIPSNRRELFLTFDDGPVRGPTEFVLETLGRLSAKATFFCIGENIRKHPDVFKKIISGGHTVGNHTFNHLNGWRTDTNRYVDNMQQCTKEIQAQLPEYHDRLSPALFRPPYGRITRNQINALKHCKIIMWDVLSIDYNNNLAADKCLKNTIQATRNGSVVVFHDSVKAEKNLTHALPRYIEHFSSLGFQFNIISA